MPAIVAGTSLGLGNTSFDWANGRTVLGNAAFGSDGTRIYINAQTGNLVVQRMDDLLDTTGADIEDLRTYNSLGQTNGTLNGDGNDYWLNGLTSSLGAVQGTVNKTGSSVVLTDVDGTQETFAYDVGSGKYLRKQGGVKFLITQSATYDAFNRVTTVTNGNGFVTTIAYDAVNRTMTVKDALNHTVVTQYNRYGQTVSVTDPDGNVSTYGYDGDGNLISESLPAERTLTLTYDGGDNLSTVTDATGPGTSNNTIQSFTYQATATGDQLATELSSVTPYTTPSGSTTEVAGSTKNGGTTTNYYDNQGFLVYSSNSLDTRFNRSFVNNSAGEVVQEHQYDTDLVPAGATLRNVIVNGQVLLSYGQQMDPNTPSNSSNNAPNIITVDTLATGYQPIASLSTAPNPQQTSTTYRTSAGDTLQGIAYMVYGDASMWYLIANANGLSASSSLTQGMLLIIPAAVTGANNNTHTFTPYNVANYVANVTPFATQSAQQMSCGQIGLLIAAVIVGVLAFIVTAGASTALITAAIGAEAGSAAAAGASIAGGAIGGAASSIVQQGVLIAGGMQRDFSGTDVAAGALGGAVFLGAGAAVGAIVRGSGLASQIASASFADISNAATMAQASRAAAMYTSKVAISTGGFAAVTTLNDAIDQGVRMGAGEQSAFNWKEVAAAAIAGVGLGAGLGIGAARMALSNPQAADAVDLAMGGTVGGVGANLHSNDGQLDTSQLIQTLAQNLAFGAVGARLASKGGKAQAPLQREAVDEPAAQARGAVLIGDGSTEAVAAIEALQSQLPNAEGHHLGDAGLAQADLGGRPVAFVGHNTPENQAAAASFLTSVYQGDRPSVIYLLSCNTKAAAQALYTVLGEQTPVVAPDGPIRVNSDGTAAFQDPDTLVWTYASSGVTSQRLGTVDPMANDGWLMLQADDLEANGEDRLDSHSPAPSVEPTRLDVIDAAVRETSNAITHINAEGAFATGSHDGGGAAVAHGIVGSILGFGFKLAMNSIFIESFNQVAQHAIRTSSANSANYELGTPLDWTMLLAISAMPEIGLQLTNIGMRIGLSATELVSDRNKIGEPWYQYYEFPDIKRYISSNHHPAEEKVGELKNPQFTKARTVKYVVATTLAGGGVAQIASDYIKFRMIEQMTVNVNPLLQSPLLAVSFYPLASFAKGTIVNVQGFAGDAAWEGGAFPRAKEFQEQLYQGKLWRWSAVDKKKTGYYGTGGTRLFLGNTAAQLLGNIYMMGSSTIPDIINGVTFPHLGFDIWANLLKYGLTSTFREVAARGAPSGSPFSSLLKRLGGTIPTMIASHYTIMAFLQTQYDFNDPTQFDAIVHSYVLLQISGIAADSGRIIISENANSTFRDLYFHLFEKMSEDSKATMKEKEEENRNNLKRQEATRAIVEQVKNSDRQYSEDLAALLRAKEEQLATEQAQYDARLKEAANS